MKRRSVSPSFAQEGETCIKLTVVQTAKASIIVWMCLGCVHKGLFVAALTSNQWRADERWRPTGR